VSLCDTLKLPRLVAARMTATAAAAGTTAPPYPNTPVIDQTMAILCLVLNVFVPGLGTIVSGILGEKPLIGRGIAQFVLTLVIVGWVWGIVTGIQLISNATWKERRSSQTHGPAW